MLCFQNARFKQLATSLSQEKPDKKQSFRYRAFKAVGKSSLLGLKRLLVVSNQWRGNN
ncbi:MAG: hypothetical protein V3V31_13355 [Methylococcales bacterium]